MPNDQEGIRLPKDVSGDIPLSGWLRWAEIRLWNCYDIMATTGAPPDTLQELDEICQQIYVMSINADTATNPDEIWRCVKGWMTYYNGFGDMGRPIG